MIADDEIEKLKREHDEVHVITAGDFSVAVRTPKRADVRRWQDTASVPAKRVGATEQLVRDCVVYPDHAAYDALIERKPLLPMTFGEKLLEIAGLIQDADAKKA
jgi:hypothetical protein